MSARDPDQSVKLDQPPGDFDRSLAAVAGFNWNMGVGNGERSIKRQRVDSVNEANWPDARKRWQQWTELPSPMEVELPSTTPIGPPPRPSFFLNPAAGASNFPLVGDSNVIDLTYSPSPDPAEIDFGPLDGGIHPQRQPGASRVLSAQRVTFPQLPPQRNRDGVWRPPSGPRTRRVSIPQRARHLTFVHEAEPMVKPVVPTKPFVVEPPKWAPKKADGKAFELRPWKGNGVEDMLNERTVRFGFSDRWAGIPAGQQPLWAVGGASQSGQSGANANATPGSSRSASRSNTRDGKIDSQGHTRKPSGGSGSKMPPGKEGSAHAKMPTSQQQSKSASQSLSSAGKPSQQKSSSFSQQQQPPIKPGPSTATATSKPAAPPPIPPPSNPPTGKSTAGPPSTSGQPSHPLTSLTSKGASASAAAAAAAAQVFTVPPPHIETASARQLVWPILKHRSGLGILNTLFSALNARQDSDRSVKRGKRQFKLPPRVTLTDGKREAWMRDLADERVPLRKLSRTVPHGIRGKSLLEGCALKSVPVRRAGWLARCVGAIEMKAGKRKPTLAAVLAGKKDAAAESGGELKWVREWTLSVQAFLEAIADEIKTSEGEGWSEKMRYALDLANHFYGTGLLDRQQFLEWVIGAFRQADDSMLPIWMAVFKTFGTHMISSRRRGRMAVLAMAEQLKRIQSSEKASWNRDNWDLVSATVRDFFQREPRNFVIPIEWDSYRQVIELCLEDEPREAFDELVERNERYMRRVDNGEDEYIREAQLLQSGDSKLIDNIPLRRQLIMHLNHLPPVIDFDRLYLDLMEFVYMLVYEIDPEVDEDDPDIDVTEAATAILTTLIQWATTTTAGGGSLSRVYAAANVLRLFADNIGTDPQPIVLALLASPQRVQRSNFSLLGAFIADLVRTSHFDVAHYLQWLLARGMLKRGGNGRPAASAILKSIPPGETAFGRGEHLINLRNMVLAECDSACAQPKKDVKQARTEIARGIRFLRGSTPVEEDFCGLEELDRSSKLAVGSWLKEKIQKTLLLHKNKAKQKLKGGPIQSLTSADLADIHQAFETLQDYANYADVLTAITGACQRRLLRDIALIAGARLSLFHSLDAAEPLLGKLIERLNEEEATEIKPASAEEDGDIDMKFLPTTPQPPAPPRGITQKPLMLALAELAERLPGQQAAADDLRHEVAAAAGESAAAVIAACSPVSDQMAEALQEGSGDGADSRGAGYTAEQHAKFVEDVEALYASGTSMERSVLGKVFGEIVARYASIVVDEFEADDGSLVDAATYMDLLRRLRMFDEEEFDSQLLQWALKDMRVTVVRPLVSDGVLQLKEFVEACLEKKELVAKLSAVLLGGRQEAPKSALRCSPVVDWTYVRTKMHRFDVQVYDLLSQKPELVSAYVAAALESDLGDEVESEVAKPAFSDLLLSLTSRNPTLVLERKETFGSLPRGSVQGQAFDRMLNIGEGSGENALVELLDTANEFSVVMCRLRIKSVCEAFSDEETGKQAMRNFASEIAQGSVEFDPAVARKLIPAITPNLASELYTAAMGEVFKMLPIYDASTIDALSTGKDRQAIERVLTVIDAAETAASSESLQALIKGLDKRMASLHENYPRALAVTLADGSEPARAGARERKRQQNARVSTLSSYVHICTQLFSIHFAKLQAHGSLLAGPVKYLFDFYARFRLFRFPPQSPGAPSSIEEADLLDAIAVLSDALSPDEQLECAQFLRAKHPNTIPRLIESRTARSLGSPIVWAFSYLFTPLEDDLVDAGLSLLMNEDEGSDAEEDMAPAREQTQEKGVVVPHVVAMAVTGGPPGACIPPLPSPAPFLALQGSVASTPGIDTGVASGAGSTPQTPITAAPAPATPMSSTAAEKAEEGEIFEPGLKIKEEDDKMVIDLTMDLEDMKPPPTPSKQKMEIDTPAKSGQVKSTTVSLPPKPPTSTPTKPTFTTLSRPPPTTTLPPKPPAAAGLPPKPQAPAPEKSKARPAPPARQSSQTQAAQPTPQKQHSRSNSATQLPPQSSHRQALSQMQTPQLQLRHSPQQISSNLSAGGDPTTPPGPSSQPLPSSAAGTPVTTPSLSHSFSMPSASGGGAGLGLPAAAAAAPAGKPSRWRCRPFAARPWDLVPDAAPVVGENDAPIDLRLFGVKMCERKEAWRGRS